MTSRFLICRPIPLGLIAVLAACPAFAQESLDSAEVAEAAERDRTRSSVLYIDRPVPIEAGLDPVMPSVEALPGSDPGSDPGSETGSETDQEANQEADQEADPETDPEFARRLDSIRQYNLTVSDIELDGGAWDNNLVQELSTLGGLQQQQGDHLAAIETLDRAVHVNRINSGLYTLEQVPVVEQLIQSYMALGNWEEADIYNRYLFHVQQKAYGPDDPRLIPVLDSMASWNIQAFNIGYGDLRGIRLQESQIMLNAAARMVGVHFGKSDERFVSYLTNIAHSAYLVSINPELMMQRVQPEYRSAQQLLAQRLNEQGQVLPPGFRTGERALLEIVEFYYDSGDDIYALAEAITNLADWYLMFDRRRGALMNYQQAWQILQTQENSEELTQRLFGRVVLLPSFTSSVETPMAFYQAGEDTDALRFDYADLMFDVVETGIVRNVKHVSARTEANQAQLGKLRTSIRTSRFRPLIVDGKPQRSNDHYFRYRYWY